MVSLSEKLESLGVKIGTRDLPSPRPRNPYRIQEVIPGDFHQTSHGEVFLVERCYPLEYQQGLSRLRPVASLAVIAEWAREPGLAKIESEVCAFLDTETTGLVGGTGTYAFLVGIGRYDGELFQLTQFFMRDPAEEPALLAALTELLEPCQMLVTFNGKACDVPLLRTRYITNGELFPFAGTIHLDLLPLARRLWRNRLPSRALGYLEEHILGVRRAHDDVPGWLIPSLYFDYLRSGDARPLKGVFYHNAMDVLSMAALLSHMASLLNDPLNEQGAREVITGYGFDLVALARLFEDVGQLEKAAQLYEHGLKHDLPQELYWETVQRLSLVHKRRGELPAAVTLWRQAADNGQVYAYVELAKYCEHQLRDYEQARIWTQAAIDLITGPAFSRHESQRWLADLKYRLARLETKR